MTESFQKKVVCNINLSFSRFVEKSKNKYFHLLTALSTLFLQYQPCDKLSNPLYFRKVEFCEAKLSSKYTLKTHQTRTKKCLKAQQKMGISIDSIDKFMCQRHFFGKFWFEKNNYIFYFYNDMKKVYSALTLKCPHRPVIEGLLANH